jgi:outer membrane protein assembly factor BamB
MLDKRLLGFVRRLFLLLAAAPAGTLTAEDWPQFRGPTGDGVALVSGTPVRWGGLLRPPAWKTDIPGRGWSSPVVVQGKIWLTTAEQTALDQEALAEKLASHPYGNEEFQTHASITLLAVELDAREGRILRRIELATIENPPPIHFTNSYASPTPVSDGERLYCHFGSLGTFALEMATGDIPWRQRFDLDDITGPGTSPVWDDGRLILACDGVDDQFVVALEGTTGNELWRTQRPPLDEADEKHRRSFSTPLVFEDRGRRQLVAPAARWIVSYDPVTGEELWRVDGGEGMHAAVPRPVYREGVVYVCNGYPKPELWAIRTDGQGDVTDSHVLWTCARQVPEISSPVVTDQHIYFVSTGGVMSCLERETGSQVWQERLNGTFVASPLLAGGKLYLTNTEGTTWVLQPGEVYEELSCNRLRVQCFASLALYGSHLLVRSHPTLFCLRGEGEGELGDLGASHGRFGARVAAE